MPKNVRRIRQRAESDAMASVLDTVQDFLASVQVKKLEKKTQSEYSYVLLEFAEWCRTHTLVQDRKDKS